MINLCLVVIATQFSETKKRETERMRMERKRYHSSSTLASLSEPGGCYEEIIKYIAHIWRRSKRKIKRRFNMNCQTAQTRRLRKVTPEKAISLRSRRRKKQLQTVHLHHHHHHHHHHYHISNGNLTRNTDPCGAVAGSRASSRVSSRAALCAQRASPEVSDIDTMSSPRRPTYLSVPSTDVSARQSRESLQVRADVTASSSGGRHTPRPALTQQPQRARDVTRADDSSARQSYGGLLQPRSLDRTDPVTSHNNDVRPSRTSLRRASSLKTHKVHHEDYKPRKNSFGDVDNYVTSGDGGGDATDYDLRAQLPEADERSRLHLPSADKPGSHQGLCLKLLIWRVMTRCDV